MLKILDTKSDHLKNQIYLPCYEKYCAKMNMELEKESYEIDGQPDSEN